MTLLLILLIIILIGGSGILAFVVKSVLAAGLIGLLAIVALVYLLTSALRRA